MSKGKVTVLKMMANHELIEAYAHRTATPCDRLQEGQVFVIENWDEAPKGFCERAWTDLAKKVELTRHLDVVVACCTDGFRPVVFENDRRD